MVKFIALKEEHIGGLFSIAALNANEPAPPALPQLPRPRPPSIIRTAPTPLTPLLLPLPLLPAVGAAITPSPSMAAAASTASSEPSTPVVVVIAAAIDRRGGRWGTADTRTGAGAGTIAAASAARFSAAASLSPVGVDGVDKMSMPPGPLGNGWFLLRAEGATTSPQEEAGDNDDDDDDDDNDAVEDREGGMILWTIPPIPIPSLALAPAPAPNASGFLGFSSTMEERGDCLLFGVRLTKAKRL